MVCVTSDIIVVRCAGRATLSIGSGQDGFHFLLCLRLLGGLCRAGGDLLHDSVEILRGYDRMEELYAGVVWKSFVKELYKSELELEEGDTLPHTYKYQECRASGSHHETRTKNA